MAARFAGTRCSSSAGISARRRGDRVRADGQQHQRSLPQALGLIDGERTKESVLDAFAAAQSGHPDVDSEGPVHARRPTGRASRTSRSRCSTCRNPVTGDFIIPAPRANAQLVSATDAACARRLGNVVGRRKPVGAAAERAAVRVPAGSGQPQDRRAAHRQQPPERHVLLLGLPGARLRSPIPAAWCRLFTLTPRRPGARLCAVRHPDLERRRWSASRGPACSSWTTTASWTTRSWRSRTHQVGMPNPATFFDYERRRRTRLGHYIGNPGTILERFSFGGPNDSFNQREQWIYSVGQTMTWSRGLAHDAVRWRVQVQHVRHQPARRSRRPSSRSSRTSRCSCAASRAKAIRSSASPTKQFRFQDFNAVRGRRLAAVAEADAQPRASVTSSSAGRGRRTAGSATSTSQRITNTENPIDAFIVPSNAATTGFNAIDQTLAVTATGRQQAHAQRLRLEQRRAAAGIRLDADGRQQAGRPRRLRHLLRPAIGRVHQHGVQQLPVPARGRGDLPRSRGAVQRRRSRSRIRTIRSPATCRTASSGPAAPPAPIRSVTARQVTTGRRRHAEPDRSGDRAALPRQHRRDVRVPRRSTAI